LAHGCLDLREVERRFAEGLELNSWEPAWLV